MFCPNCGTKNDEGAAKCRQCGFELKSKAAPAKFKGTMLMTSSPVAGAGAKPGAPTPGSPAPGAGAPTGGQPSSGTPGGTLPRSALKGTMVGVAPPSIGGATPGTPGPGTPGPGTPALGGAQPGGPAQASPPAQASGGRPAKLKGTMIGVAPPTIGGPAKGAPAAPGAPGAEARDAGAPPAGSGGGGTPPKLKGTMIGVAPPNVAEMLRQAQGQAAPEPSEAAPEGTAKTEFMPAQDAAPGVARTEAMPAYSGGASGVAKTEAIPQAADPLGGTMVGGPVMSPGFDQQVDAVGSTEPPPAPGGPPVAAEVSAYNPEADSGDSSLAAGGRSDLALAHGPVGKDRSPVVVFLLSMFCVFYAIYALISMLSELREFRQKNDISLILFFIPIINIIEVWKLPGKVADAQRMAGITNPQVAHPILYLFFGIYFLPADLNEVWEAARRNG